MLRFTVRFHRNAHLLAYTFFPYGEELEILNEEQLRERVPYYYNAYLKPNQAKLARRASIDPSKWWQLIRPRTMSLEQTPKIVSTYFGDAGSFGWDEDGRYLIVEGSAWLAKGQKRTGNFTNIAGLAYLALLNSMVFSQLLSATSSHVGGGQWDLSKQYVENIPLPDFFDSKFDSELLRALAAIGNEIHKGIPVEDKNKEDLVNQAYGIL